MTETFGVDPTKAICGICHQPWTGFPHDNCYSAPLMTCPRCGRIVGTVHTRPECDAFYAQAYTSASARYGAQDGPAASAGPSPASPDPEPGSAPQRGIGDRPATGSMGFPIPRIVTVPGMPEDQILAIAQPGPGESFDPAKHAALITDVAAGEGSDNLLDPRIRAIATNAVGPAVDAYNASHTLTTDYWLPITLRDAIGKAVAHAVLDDLAATGRLLPGSSPEVDAP